MPKTESTAPKDRCPECGRPLALDKWGRDQHAAVCPFSDENLLGPPGRWDPVSFDTAAATEDAILRLGSRDPEIRKKQVIARRIVPLLGANAGRNVAAENVDRELDHLRLVEERRRILFEIYLHPKRAVLWAAEGERGPSGLAPILRPVMGVPLAEKAKLYAEAKRRQPGIRPENISVHQAETRGRPRAANLDTEWARDRHAAFLWLRDRMAAGGTPEEIEADWRQSPAREMIRTKYSMRNSCPVCGGLVPDAWTRKECSARCRQQAHLRRKKQR